MKPLKPLKPLIEILDSEGCSLVIRSQGKEQCYWKRGVADLFHLLRNEPEVLLNAQLADKVIGKGAAALMVLGGVKEVYAHTISYPALQLLEAAGISVSYSQCVELHRKLHSAQEKSTRNGQVIEKLP